MRSHLLLALVALFALSAPSFAADETKPAAPATPPAPALATPPPAEAPPSAAELKESIRREVLEEVRKEMDKEQDAARKQAEFTEADSTARVQDAEALQEMKRRVELLVPHGYLRWRGDYFHNLDLGRGADPTGHFLAPVPVIGPDSQSLSDTNLRFRLEPLINVAEQLSIHTQIDLLDNVLFGSDPFADPLLDPFTPASSLSTGRLLQRINVRRAWGEVGTPAGKFLFGRMGDHFGLGILHNDGNCLDCDYGDTVDRVAFAFNLKGYLVVPMVDLLLKSPSTTAEGAYGQALAEDTLGDSLRLALAVSRLDNDEEIRRHVANGEVATNWGARLDYVTQPWVFAQSSATSLSANRPGGIDDLHAAAVKRDAQYTALDLWGSLRWTKLRLESELAGQLGHVNHRAATVATFNDPQQDGALTFQQLGGVLQGDYAFLGADALLLGMEVGFASGDPAPGFGARPNRSGSSTSCAAKPGAAPATPFATPAVCATAAGDIDGPKWNASTGDLAINNFRFNRDYRLDLILFRQIVTQVTGAWYLRPSLSYKLGGRKSGGGEDIGLEGVVQLVYAQATNASSTPGGQAPLGVEADAFLRYTAGDGFFASLAYGALFPLGGLDNRGGNTFQVEPRSASLAQTLRFIAAIPF